VGLVASAAEQTTAKGDLMGARATAGLVSGAVALAIACGNAMAASTPVGGQVDAFIAATHADSATIIFTGAIGDSGSTTSVDKNGKVDPAGDYATVTLSKGGFVVDKTALEKAITNVNPKINKATCSAGLSVRAPVQLAGGTGLYKGISGTLQVTEFVGFISPRYSSGKNAGQCNLGVAPTSQLDVTIATGSVSF
jgi:hypothetical protein